MFKVLQTVSNSICNADTALDTQSMAGSEPQAFLVKQETVCPHSPGLVFLPCDGLDTFAEKSLLRHGGKKLSLASIFSPSLLEWQNMQCRFKNQKFTITPHKDNENVTMHAKRPENEVTRDGDKVSTDLRDPEVCLAVKPANQLCCEVCLQWANVPRLVVGACRLHLHLDLAALVEARLSSNAVEEKEILESMNGRDYTKHSKVRLLPNTQMRMTNIDKLCIPMLYTSINLVGYCDYISTCIHCSQIDLFATVDVCRHVFTVSKFQLGYIECMSRCSHCIHKIGTEIVGIFW